MYVNKGPALMAVWFKALPLPVSCLPPLSEVEFHPRNVQKLPVVRG